MGAVRYESGPGTLSQDCPSRRHPSRAPPPDCPPSRTLPPPPTTTRRCCSRRRGPSSTTGGPDGAVPVKPRRGCAHAPRHPHSLSPKTHSTASASCIERRGLSRPSSQSRFSFRIRASGRRATGSPRRLGLPAPWIRRSVDRVSPVGVLLRIARVTAESFHAGSSPVMSSVARSKTAGPMGPPRQEGPGQGPAVLQCSTGQRNGPVGPPTRIQKHGGD